MNEIATSAYHNNLLIDWSTIMPSETIFLTTYRSLQQADSYKSLLASMQTALSELPMDSLKLVWQAKPSDTAMQLGLTGWWLCWQWTDSLTGEDKQWLQIVLELAGNNRFLQQRQVRFPHDLLLEDVAKGLQTAVNHISQTFSAPTTFIGLHNRNERQIHFPAFLLNEQQHQQPSISDQDPASLTAWAVQTGQLYQTKDLTQIQLPVKGLVILPDKPMRSAVFVPLQVDSTLLGVLSIQSPIADAFPTEDIALLQTSANELAILLHIANQQRQLQTDLSQWETLYEANASMTANLDQDFVLQSVAAEMVRALPIDSCTIFVRDESSHGLYPAAHKNKLQQDQSLNDLEHIIGVSTIENLERYGVVRRTFQQNNISVMRRDQARDDEEAIFLDAAELEAIALVPLIRRKRVVGLLALGQLNEFRTLAPDQLRLAENLASQASVAIEHARLYSQSQRRVEELSAFNEIVLQLNTALDLNSVLDTITNSALRMIQASNLHIYLYDSKKGEFTFGSALWHDGRREPAVPSLRKNGLTNTVIQKGESLVINDAENHPLFQSEKARAWGIYAIAGFPLKTGGEVIGAFTVTYLYPHTFTEDELLLLHLLAEQAAVAVKNAHLFNESNRQLQVMSALVDMAQKVTSNLNLEVVLQTTVESIHKLLSARASTITMLTDKGDELVVKATSGVDPQFVNARMKLGEGISGQVVETGKQIYIEDTYSKPDFLFFDDVVRSLLAVPLRVRDEVIGTMTVDSDRPYAFDDTHIKLMTIAAAQVSIALSNAGLFEELASAYEVLKESDRLKDELVQNVSHELRTPLTFVKGYVDLLMDGEMGLVSLDQMDALTIVSDKTDEITRLIDDIMALQRIDSGNLKLTPYPMEALLETAVSNHQLVAQDKGIAIVLQNPNEQASMVTMDAGRINQVLNNLLGNAMKFSPDGGTITVGIETFKDHVQIMVADEGIGVPKEQLKKIFERFYQIDGSARRHYSGTGLGLAIVKRIIDAHKGQIWVESEINKGSAFYFTLPKKRSHFL